MTREEKERKRMKEAIGLLRHSLADLHKGVKKIETCHPTSRELHRLHTYATRLEQAITMLDAEIVSKCK